MSAKRYSVQAIHNGTDVAVVDATPEDIATADTEGWAMTHADAVALAKETAAEQKCRWFDMSTPEENTTR